MTELFILEEQPKPEPIKWRLVLARQVPSANQWQGLGQFAAAGFQQLGSRAYETETETKPVTVEHLIEAVRLLTHDEQTRVATAIYAASAGVLDEIVRQIAELQATIEAWKPVVLAAEFIPAKSGFEEIAKAYEAIPTALRPERAAS